MGINHSWGLHYPLSRLIPCYRITLTMPLWPIVCWTIIGVTTLFKCKRLWLLKFLLWEYVSLQTISDVYWKSWSISIVAAHLYSLTQCLSPSLWCFSGTSLIMTNQNATNPKAELDYIHNQFEQEEEAEKESKPNVLRSSSKFQMNRKMETRSSGFTRHLWVLLWKNLLLRRRKIFFLLIEILIPLMIPIILISLRTVSPDKFRPNCQSQTVSLPSMGTLVHVQSMLCNFMFSCQTTDPPPLSLMRELTFLEQLARDPLETYVRRLYSVVDLLV